MNARKNNFSVSTEKGKRCVAEICRGTVVKDNSGLCKEPVDPDEEWGLNDFMYFGRPSEGIYPDKDWGMYGVSCGPRG